MTAPTARYRVLLVEDESLVAMLIEDFLLELGCDVVETAGRIDRALAAAEGGTFDFAILDLNLGGERTYPVADALSRRGIPFVFATGYGQAGLTGAHTEAPTLQKPFRQSDLAAAISAIMADRRSGNASAS